LVDSKIFKRKQIFAPKRYQNPKVDEWTSIQQVVPKFLEIWITTPIPAKHTCIHPCWSVWCTKL